MIAFATIPKPFTGHADTIQRNAIASWLRVHPDARVLLLGDDEGVAEAAASLGVEHRPDLARNEHGTPRLDSAFALAVEWAGARPVCYANADILLPPSLAGAARIAAARARRFLVVGECRNVRVETLLDPDRIDWPALRRGARRRGADALDYFLFSPGLFDGMPPFAVGRTVWDNWLVWRARAQGALVVDASSTVGALHQDHSYVHMGSLTKIRVSPEADVNRRLAGGKARLYSRYDATHRLTPFGLVPNPLALGHGGERARRGWAKLGYRTGLRKA